DFAERIKYPLRGKQRDKAPCLRHRNRPGNPMRDEAAPGQPQDIVLRHDDLDLGIAAEKTSRAGNGNIIAEVDRASGKGAQELIRGVKNPRPRRAERSRNAPEHRRAKRILGCNGTSDTVGSHIDDACTSLETVPTLLKHPRKIQSCAGKVLFGNASFPRYEDRRVVAQNKDLTAPMGDV